MAGFDPTRQPLEVKRRVGYLPDDVGFYGEMTGAENLRYTAALNGIERRAANDRIGLLLEQVGLADAADRRVEQYSRGMRQRLGLADALVKDPSILILDEPTASIDPAGVTEVLALIQSLARDSGVTVLLSSHLLHQVHQVCDRVAIFNAGRILAQGRMSELAAELAGDQLELEVGVDGPARPGRSGPARRRPAWWTCGRDPHDPRLWLVTGPQSSAGTWPSTSPPAGWASGTCGAWATSSTRSTCATSAGTRATMATPPDALVLAGDAPSPEPSDTPPGALPGWLRRVRRAWAGGSWRSRSSATGS